MQVNNKKIGLKNETDGVYSMRLTAAAIFIAVAAAFIPSALFMDLMYSHLYINFGVSVAITVFGFAVCAKLIGAFKPMLPLCFIAVASVLFSLPFSAPCC